MAGRQPGRGGGESGGGKGEGEQGGGQKAAIGRGHVGIPSVSDHIDLERSRRLCANANAPPDFPGARCGRGTEPAGPVVIADGATRLRSAILTNFIDTPGLELERRFVEADEGLDLAWAEAGQGPPVVLLHGTLTTLEDMTISLAERLGRSHRVIAFDRPGFGRSTVRRFLDAGVGRQGERLHRAIASLGLESPVIVGHSFGASVALAMAVQEPSRIAGVVAIAPLVLPEPRLEHMIFGPRAAPFAGELVQAGAHATTDRALLPLLWRAMWLPQVMPESVRTGFPFALAGRSGSACRIGEDAMAAAFDLPALVGAAAACPVPVCIMGGDRDLVVNNGANGRALAALMPRGAFIDLPGLGHMAHHFAADRIAGEVERLTREGAIAGGRGHAAVRSGEGSS